MKKVFKIEIDDAVLDGELVIPDNASGLVIFCHGNSYSRFSPRNQYIARHFHRRGLATFLFDLISAEENDDELRFDIEILSQRLIKGTEWLLKKTRLQKLPIGYFGASTGVAAALVGASVFQTRIGAVVSRGGRPDLAVNQLYQVKTPTLFIIGENDSPVLDLNWQALEKLSGDKNLKIIEGASPSFEEPGALEQVAELSGDWFINYLNKESISVQDEHPIEHTKSFFSMQHLSRSLAWHFE
jgi:putative phosphoribosyl transferase